SGNGKCVKAGKLSSLASGPKSAFEQVQPYLATIAASGVAYVGEGELARICKIAHNVFLGVVIQNLAEITILAQKAGVPRHAFLDFMNASVMGSTFSRYKSNALVNLDWTTTFTPALLRKDLDLGLKRARDLDVPLPVTSATPEPWGESGIGSGQDSASRPHAPSLDRVGRIVVARCRGMARDDETVDQCLILGREAIVERADVVVPLRLGARAGDDRRDERRVQ